MKRHEVQVLRKAGLTRDEIAKRSGVSRRCVTDILNEPLVEELVLKTVAGDGRVGRPSTALPFTPNIQELFKAEPDLPTVEVLRRMRLQGYTGGKTALYEIVAELRPRPTPPPVVRFEGVPGEFSQHDFGKLRVKFTGTGREEMVIFFASRMKWSRWSHVQVVKSEAVESLVRALLMSLADFQGVPLVCVFDNPKTIVLKHEGSVIEWNSTFAQVAIDMRFAAELCTPARGNEKGAVENLVKWVKNSFFKVRRFHDRADLDRQLVEWLKEINERRPSRATGEIPAKRLAEEKKRLRPLPIAPSDYALRIPIMVGPTGHVVYQNVRYSMPAKAIGFSGTLFLYPERVTIMAGPYSADHPRHPETPGISWRPEHRADLLASVSGERGQLYLKRQQLFELGPDAVDFLTEIVHLRKYTWKPEVERLYELLTKHGGPLLLSTMKEAAGRHLYGAEYVAQLLRETA